MRIRKIFFAVALILIPQMASAAQLTDAELLDCGPVKQHHTKEGTIVCSEPQIKFDEQAWLTDGKRRGGGRLREHMLVDTIVNGTLLHKKRSDVDALFQGIRQDFPGFSRYSVFQLSGGCGNVPRLLIEAHYDKELNLIEYRSRYYEDGGSPASVDSNWVK